MFPKPTSATAQSNDIYGAEHGHDVRPPTVAEAADWLKDGTQPGVLPGLFGALEARYGRLCGEAGVRSGAGIGAAVDQ